MKKIITKKKLKEQISFLENELTKAESKIVILEKSKNCYEELFKWKREEYIELIKKYHEQLGLYKVSHIIHNKNATIVWFSNCNKVVVKRQKDDSDSVYSAVAYAIMKNKHKSNAAFKRYVDERIINNEK